MASKKEETKDLASTFFQDDEGKIKSIFNENYQNRFIKCFVEAEGFAEQIIDIIVPEFFEGYQRLLIDKLIKYYNVNSSCAEYETIKREVFKTENDQSNINYLIGLVDKISSMEIKDHKDVKDTALIYFKKQGLKNALKRCAQMWRKDDYDSIATVISNALKAAEPKDTGHNYLKDANKRLKVNYRNPIPFLHGLNADLGGGLSGGELGIVMAPTGGGKSMCLVKFGAEAMKAGKKVIYYTLELVERSVGQRFDACLINRPLRDIYEYADDIKKEAERITALGGELYIKEYPSGKASIHTIKAHLTSMERVHGFIPDLIIIDYIDLMKPLTQHGEMRHNLADLYSEVRAMALERNVPVWSCAQTTRAAVEQEEINTSHMGEAYAKAQIADVIIAVVRTKDMKKEHRAKFWVLKNRNGHDGYFKDAHFDTSRVDIRITDVSGVLPTSMVSKLISDPVEVEGSINKLLSKDIAEDIYGFFTDDK